MTRRQRIAAGTAAGFAGLIGLGFVRWAVAARTPEVNIPARQMPQPNAFDVFVRATRQYDKKAADRALRGNKKLDEVPPAERDNLVRQNAAALATLRSGFTLPYVEPRYTSASALWPHLAGYRGLARVLVLEGYGRRDRGDRTGATDSWCDAVQAGQQMANGGPLIHRLVSVACQAIGRRPLWKSLDSLDATSAKHAARRMEEISARHVPYSETITEEKYFGQHMLMEAFNNPSDLASMFNPGDGSDDSPKMNPATARFGLNLMYLVWSKQTILDNNANHMNAMAAQAAQPYAVSHDPLPLPGDPLNRILLPVFEQARMKDVNSSETQNALITASLAVRAYQAEHGGAAPESLDALRPAYLSRVPSDPFAAQFGTPLRYKRTAANTYALYSIGPDGKDDNGTAIDNPKETNEVNRRAVRPESKGDIVAGVNIY